MAVSPQSLYSSDLPVSYLSTPVTDQIFADIHRALMSSATSGVVTNEGVTCIRGIQNVSDTAGDAVLVFPAPSSATGIVERITVPAGSIVPVRAIKLLPSGTRTKDGTTVTTTLSTFTVFF